MQDIQHKAGRFIKHKFDLTSINRRFNLVFFTIISAFLFLNFFEPFGLYYDKQNSPQEVFVELFVAMGFAFIILIITQFVLRPFFKYFKLTVWELIAWFMLEAGLVAITWSFLDVSIKTDNRSVFTLWAENLLAYVMIMVLPYSLFIMYIYFRDRLMPIENEESEESSQRRTIAINDESGETKLLLNIDNLLFIQSADNYVEVNYLENNVLTKTLVRNSIKKLESELLGGPIIRCHRSYMLNTEKIETARKTSSGFNVKIHQLEEPSIPVSRSYVSELKKSTSVLN